MSNTAISLFIIVIMILGLGAMILILLRMSNKMHVRDAGQDRTIQTLKMMSDVQDQRLKDLNDQFNRMSVENEVKLDNIRTTLETRINHMQNDNKDQLEKMRTTVDEKLQQTLEERLSKSFRIVNEQLDRVSKGFGEMQVLASDVGDLKKVLSNVKTRGNLGELQLGAILREILSPEQYEENVATIPGATERVEFAVKLPGDDDGTVFLPIDAKFPANRYEDLMDAYESGDKVAVETAQKALITTLKLEAKDIRNKYVQPPHTTDFAIMFLPVEGLYAEAVKLGMVEEFQKNEYKINIAGPTSMAALLNSLQMGFRTLAIQKHSSEVWDTLAGVKSEFLKFEEALGRVQKRLRQADSELETLVGTRTNQINRKLKKVEALKDYDGDKTLEDVIDEEDDD